MIATLGQSGISANLGNPAISARLSNSGVTAELGDAAIAATLGNDSKSVTMAPVRIVTIDVTPTEIAGEFIIPAIVPLGFAGIYLYNGSSSTITIAGEYYDANGNLLGDDPFSGGFFDLPAGAGVVTTINYPSTNATLRVYVLSGTVTLSEFWGQLAEATNEDDWLWQDMIRPRVINEDASASDHLARSGIVYTGNPGFDMAWGIVNLTGYNDQAPRAIECTYVVTSLTGGAVLASGTVEIPAGGIFGSQVSLMGLGTPGWINLRVDANCRSHELKIAHFLITTFGDGSFSQTHGFTDFQAVN